MAALIALPGPAHAGAGIAPGPDLPVLSRQVARGTGEFVRAESVAPGPRRVDGALDDWRGRGPGFAGVALYSAGELIYQDHLFDAYGPDDGSDAQRVGVLDPIAEQVPETYRLDPVYQANLLGQFLDDEFIPDPVEGSTIYGDMRHQDAADLLELRLAADDSHLYVLARTTTMLDPNATGVLLLVDDEAGGAQRSVPFGSGLRTSSAETAYLFAGGRGWSADLASGEIAELPPEDVAANADDYTNAIEARIPLDPAGEGVLRVAAATGTFAPATGGFAASGLNANVANVAFRLDEPVREFFDKRQALALHAGSIDPFATVVDLERMRSGFGEIFVPGAGYHERIFVSNEHISTERGADGIHQHYGLYLPAAYKPGKPSPLQFWMHWRGGTAHTAAAVTPRIFKHLGEDRDAIVVAPRGRGTSTWYVTKGHVDFLEVWKDVHDGFTIDADRVYVTGHSMGGWASYLLPILYPDRFAAAMPVAGPVTQGAWVGYDCDPCYIGTNGGDARAQHTRRLLENVRNVPYAIYQGALDELVPVAGVTRQAERFVQLGYRHRYYLFPTYEHFTHPIVDEWADGARYMQSFTRDRNPPRVTYIRDMPFERATETVQAGALKFDFSFDSAYWMSELTPADETNGVARFDGRSFAIRQPPYLVVPEAGGPAAAGQSGPYEMTGLAWLPDPVTGAPPTTNGFEASLAGARAVRLDAPRMALDVERDIAGRITTDAPLALTLEGPWGPGVGVTVNGQPHPFTVSGERLRIDLSAGTSNVVVSPGS